jgi:hypothetical protein
MEMKSGYLLAGNLEQVVRLVAGSVSGPASDDCQPWGVWMTAEESARSLAQLKARFPESSFWREAKVLGFMFYAYDATPPKGT